MKPAKKIEVPGISWMEPMLPSDGNKASEDMAFDLISNANALAGKIHPIVTESVGDLVRSMNCYYSNLIEGHDTHPRDIDRALHKDYSAEPQKRALQLEAVAHIEVQRASDKSNDLTDAPTSSAPPGPNFPQVSGVLSTLVPDRVRYTKTLMTSSRPTRRGAYAICA